MCTYIITQSFFFLPCLSFLFFKLVGFFDSVFTAGKSLRIMFELPIFDKLTSCFAAIDCSATSLDIPFAEEELFLMLVSEPVLIPFLFVFEFMLICKPCGSRSRFGFPVKNVSDFEETLEFDPTLLV
ncbi:hypothetical protein B6A09_0245 [Saccharomyces cerevisiae synthetic construct]|uniref:Putative uncharacterized membrane protein YBL062W n=1 Tax=Saccharomyces cerevisiae (strain ATCC 204508 / S288c) TaxID=559292 RepID=YBG2_YEAST|nr:RecName: Full=Putative uncharacterized membrane protein YBL062W [Saccharomyces cerevisiae S288C]ARB01724.1 hypothetical protein B6A09_0245 [Saccharomyces cerevisiae synthetic construct]WNV71822.1 hypothetical protein O6U65_0049 [Saccharomyces cerevisiae synthetic construct]CAA84881.1 unnamed protein product [Saccharomyces cerevisiae]